MPRPKIKSDTDVAALKADFIAKRGITRCPPAGRVEPAQASLPRPVQTAAAPIAPIQRAPIQRDLGTKPVLMWVPTSELHINHAYQRTVSTKRGQAVIKDIVNAFQWPLFQPVTITQREEAGYWVIDGQHRMLAAQQIGIREIPAVLLDNLTPAQQALAFAGINGKRVSVNAYAIHHAMIAAEDPLSVRLAAVCEKTGISIPKYPKMLSVIKPNETLAIAAMKAAMKKHGDDALIWALRTIRNAFRDESGTITANSVRFLSGFYAEYADYPIHEDTILELLLDKDPEQMREECMSKAATSPDRTKLMITMLASAYNAARPAGKAALPAAEIRPECAVPQLEGSFT